MIQIITPESREAWLELRKNYITATDAVGIKGAASWSSPMSVMQDKKGLVPPSEWNKAMAIGTLLEPLIRRWFVQTREVEDHRIETAGERIWLDDATHLAATPDLVFQDETGETTMVEIKTSVRGWADEVPERVHIQVNHQAHLVKPNRVFVAHVTVHEDEQDLLLIKSALGMPITLPREPEVFPILINWDVVKAQAAEMEEWFTDHILLGSPLPEQSPVKTPELKGEVSNPELVAEWLEAKAKQKDAEDEAKAYKATRQAVEDRIAAELGTAKSLIGAASKVNRSFIAGSMSVDHEGILNALILKMPQLAPVVREIEADFISYGSGYYRWTTSALKGK